MHEEIKKLQKKVVDRACAWVEECGLESIDAEEFGEITDMIKDLSEARYYDAVADAMHVSDDPEEMSRMMERAGYDNWRYPTSGRFAPKGSGERMGYPVDYHMMPGYDGAMGYDGRGSESRSNGSYSDNGRMGYTDPSSRLANSYNEYQEYKRSYSSNKNADNRRKMEESADKHLDEIIETVKEIWSDVDQPLRVTMYNKLVKFINDDLNI